MGILVGLREVFNEVWHNTTEPALTNALKRIKDAGTDVPGQLLHFTSAHALVQILRTGKLRLSRARSSNDPRELEYGLGLARDEARTMLDRKMKWDDILLFELFASLAGRVRDGSLDPLPDPHVCCFSQPECEMGVEHWSLYGRGGAGFAFVFDGPSLAANKSADLVRVTYDVNVQKAQFSSLIEAARETCAAARNRTAAVGALDEIEKAHRAAAHAFGGVAAVHAATMKREMFKFEKEWRLMVAWKPIKIPDRDTPLEYSVEAVGPVLRSFYELPFDPKTLKAIVVGPQHADVNRPVVEALLNQYDYENVEVRVGSVSLRTFQ